MTKLFLLVLVASLMLTACASSRVSGPMGVAGPPPPTISVVSAPQK